MRILFITNLYPPYHIGGYEIACKDIVEGLKQRGHTIKVLTSTYGLKGPVIHGYVARLLNIRLKLNSPQSLLEKSSSLFFNPQNRKITKRFVNEFKPDIVSFWNVNGISASTILAVEKEGVQKVFHLFDRSLSYLRKSGIKRISNYLFFNRLNIKHLISSSSELKKDYVNRGFSENSITVIPHGVDIRKFPYKKKDISGVLKLLYVGQLWEGKGVHLLLDVVGLLNKQKVDVKLTIIGNGEKSYIDFLKKSCKKAGITDRVKFMKRTKREELIKHYQDSHIFVLPSIVREGLGIVLLEAMATGTPVIASRIGGPLDIVKENLTGFFFEQGDYKDLTSKVLLFEKNRDLINNMGQKAREKIVEQFNIKKIVDGIVICYVGIQNS